MHQEPMPEVPEKSIDGESLQSKTPSVSIHTASRDAAIFELEATRKKDPLVSAALDAASEEEREIGLFLVRPTAASAAAALNSFRVELNPESRRAQLKRLREFRNDTRESTHDAGLWVLDKQGARVLQETGGLISGGFVAVLSQSEAAALRREVKNVQVIENRVIPIISPLRRNKDELKSPKTARWHLDVIGQTLARRNGSAFSGKGVHVAILDTGVDIAHPELAGKVVDGWKLRKVSAKPGAHVVTADNNHYDTDGHGTHVAGLILGADVGVAPDATASSVTMMPRGYATTFEFISCLDWAASDPRISLLNFSAGLSPYYGDMIPFIADLISIGVLPFVAVGNSGKNTHCSPGDYAQGVSVGSVDRPEDGQPSSSKVSSFSGSATMTVDHMTYQVPDLVAPGAEIYSSYLDSGYAELDGTSMATPIACGVAACYVEKAGGQLSAADLEDELVNNCVVVRSAKHRQGAGLVQVP